MKCPKCDYEQQSAANAECERCGVIFAKYYALRNSGSKERKPGTTQSKETKTQASASLGAFFLYTKSENEIIFIIGRLVVLLLILLWGFKFVTASIESNYAGRSFMHLVNLPFHEAGHVFFRPFGSFMMSLGGTLGQLLMPLICCAVLLIKTRDTFGASVALWWFGQNFFDIAPYVNDARSLTLPLLGGNVGHSSPYGFHDWQYLLTESGLLQYDHFIARSCVITGTVIFLVSYTWCGVLLFKQYKSRV